jgi:hypothetical protein
MLPQALQKCLLCKTNTPKSPGGYSNARKTLLSRLYLALMGYSFGLLNALQKALVVFNMPPKRHRGILWVGVLNARGRCLKGPETDSLKRIWDVFERWGEWGALKPVYFSTVKVTIDDGCSVSSIY